MVIGSYIPLEIGKRYCTEQDRDGYINLDEDRQVRQPFLVLREATIEEWKQGHVEMYGYECPVAVEKINIPQWFYLISTD